MKLPGRLALASGTFALGLCVANPVVDRWFPVPASIYRADPVLLYALVPGSRKVTAGEHDAGGRWIETAINRAGHRGRELDPVKCRPRIAVLGDSLVLGETVELAETFVERVGVHAGSPTLDVETINFGVTGYGPDQACLVLETAFETLAPDLVVLVLCAHNDFGDSVRNKIFGLDGQGQAVLLPYSLEPALVAEFEAKARATRSPALLRAVEHLFEPNDRRAELAARCPYIEWALRAGPDEYSEVVLERNMRVRQVFQDYYDADVAIHPEWPSSTYKRELMRAVIARVAGDCARRSLPLVAVVVPSAVDVWPEFHMHVDRARHPTWSPGRLSAAFVQILRELNVACVDLHATFVEQGPERMFLSRNDMHWSVAGQDVAARMTVDLARASGLWPPAGVR